LYEWRVDLFGVEMPMMNPSAAGTVLGSALALEAILARRQQICRIEGLIVPGKFVEVFRIEWP